MNRTAWTASREELIRALDIATREREMWRTRAEVADTRKAALQGEAAIRNAENQRRRRERKVLAQATAQADAAQAVEAITPDPNAARHRAELIAALKEKP